MTQKLAFLDTSHVLIPMFAGLAKDLVPKSGVFHMTDESLVRKTIAAERLTPATTRRLAAMIGSAREGVRQQLWSPALPLDLQSR